MPNSMFDEVREADNAQAFKASLLSFTHAMDFATFSAILVVDKLQKRSDVISINNVPSAYLSTHDDDPSSKRDPLLRQLREIHHPIIWDQNTYVHASAGDLWEVQAAFGFRQVWQRQCICLEGDTSTSGLTAKAHFRVTRQVLRECSQMCS